MNIRIVVLITIMTTGCSTILTVGEGLEQYESINCIDGESIPRIYSGTNNSIRILGNRPLYLAPLILCDTLLSIVGDTLFLGVTIPTQISRGNMCLKRDSTVEKTSNKALQPDAPKLASLPLGRR